MMLIFVGLGLCSHKGLPLRGLELAKDSDWVYMEHYTSLLPELDLKELEGWVGKPIKVVDRQTLEENPEEILERARKGKVVLLVPGDSMVATTHVDLRLRAEKRGIPTLVVPSSSILSAAPGLTGLQSYKFGRSATIPFRDHPSTVPYDTLVENLARGLHTLLLLDLRAEEKRYMTAKEGMEIMLELEARMGRGVFTPETLVVVLARAGCPDGRVKAGRVKKLREEDFGPPPHALVVPGKLHFLEEEALRILAGAEL
ncbi:MAG: diphthine synthase [Candidatus Hadarchaeales archaeon]